MAGTDRVRLKFEALRAGYLAARAKLDEFDATLSAKYGSGYQPSWLSAGERTLKARLALALVRRGDSFTVHLTAISPRDWSYGVPCQWVRESLTFEDAVRPAGEALSVVPPLSFGSTVPRT